MTTTTDKMLTMQQILAAPDMEGTQRVDVPEWGGHVYVCKLSGGEGDAWAHRHDGEDDAKPDVRASMVAMCMSDADSNKLCVDKAQAQALGDKSIAALNRVFDSGMNFNGMTRAADEAAAKNSEATTESDSGSS